MTRRVLAVMVAGLILALPTAGRGAEAALPDMQPGAAADEEQAAAQQPSATTSYFQNRLKDFADIFSLKLALGDGGSLLGHVRLTRLLQIGGGRFSGTKVGFDGPCSGIYGEGRVEYGLSVFYWAWIGRKASEDGLSEDAVKRNQFFGRIDDIKAAATYREFYDANRAWYTVGGALSLPFLPGFEAELNPAEAVDFLLSWFNVPGLRVPPPFYKVDVTGERVPAPGSIRWHGQEEFEQYD